eukprot:342785-Pelagomonas_calceolata.AAC.1
MANAHIQRVVGRTLLAVCPGPQYSAYEPHLGCCKFILHGACLHVPAGPQELNSRKTILPLVCSVCQLCSCSL